LADLDMPPLVFSSYPHLVYWDLVARPFGPKGKQRRGVYYITPLGEDFLADEVRLHKSVWAAKGSRIIFDKSSPLVTAMEVLAENEDLILPQRRDDMARFE
jgi:hypothetical protein